jgi:molybdopterin-guanine dinucleotide biosynthesis protein A
MCRILSQAVEAVLVVAAPGQDLPGLPEFVRVVRDSTAYQGPLRGIADGLDGLPPGIEAAYVSSCDAPLLSSEWVRFMIEQLGDADIVVPVAHGRPHPLAGVYRRSVAATARRLLDQGRYRPVFLFDEHRTTQIPEDILRRIEPTLDSLENANTDEEYQRLLQRLRQRVESRGE